jgi:hypothetical protein
VTQRNQPVGILLGFLMLMGLHLLGLGVVHLLGMALQASEGGYAYLGVLIIALPSLFLWQLLYVIPSLFYFRQRGNPGIVKGLIAGAVLTALLNGGCSIVFFLGASSGELPLPIARL